MKDFTVYEYQERLARITELLRETDGWSDAYESTTGQTLIQLMVHVTDELHYMLQRRTTESYLETATLRSSVISRACELGYRFERAKANSGWLELTIQTPTLADLLIPRFTPIVREEGLYVTVNDAVMHVGESRVGLYVKHASVDSYVGMVDSNGIITISDYENIDNSIIYVSEAGVEYSDVINHPDVRKRSLSYLTADDCYYDIKYTASGMCIVFGDNIYGKRPSGEVTVQFFRVAGDTEEINKLNSPFVFDSDDEIVLDINSNEYLYTLVNTTKITGFEEPESITSIKRNATEYHKSNMRAVTNTDYAYWARQVEELDIVDSSAVGELEIDTLIYNMNNVYLTYLKSDGTDLTVDELTKLSTFMDSVKTSQAHIVYRNAKKLYIQAILAVKRNPKLSISDSELYDLLRAFLVDYFKPRLGSIGKDYQASDFVRDLYKQKITRNNVVYELIDYVKIDFNGVVCFEYPNSDANFLTIRGYIPKSGDKLTIVLGETTCSVNIYDTDSYLDIYNKLQDEIAENTPFTATLVTEGAEVDAFGNSFTQTIDNVVGNMLLVGVYTPHFSKESVIDIPVVGSSIVNKKLSAEEVFIKHHHNNVTGRQDPIPLMVDAVVSFTAPLDTHVNLYTKPSKDDATESLFTSVQPGEYYNHKFTKEHTLVFDYVRGTTEDVIVTIKYPHFDRTALGLSIKSIGWGGFFSIHVPNAVPLVEPDENGDGNDQTIRNRVGELLLVGIPTPHFSKDSLINVPTVGSDITKEKLTAPTVEFEQFIYNRDSGVKHTIPLMTDSTISFTAPNDVCIIVKTKPHKDSDDETIEAYVLHGQYYEQSFFDVHTVTLTYVNNSQLDQCYGTVGFCSHNLGECYGEFGWCTTPRPMVVTIRYPHFDKSLVQGDINQYIYLSSQIQLPVEYNKSIQPSYKDKVKRGSVHIYKVGAVDELATVDDKCDVVFDYANSEDDELMYVDDKYGNFETTSDELSPDGGVDYISGIVTIPSKLTPGAYYIIYDQDGFDNFVVDSFTVAELIAPKISFTSPDETLSTISLR